MVIYYYIEGVMKEDKKKMSTATRWSMVLRQSRSLYCRVWVQTDPPFLIEFISNFLLRDGMLSRVEANEQIYCMCMCPSIRKWDKKNLGHGVYLYSWYSWKDLSLVFNSLCPTISMKNINKICKYEIIYDISHKYYYDIVRKENSSEAKNERKEPNASLPFRWHLR